MLQQQAAYADKASACEGNMSAFYRAPFRAHICLFATQQECEMCSWRRIAVWAWINEAKVNVIVIISVETYRRWFPHHLRACVIVSNASDE